MKRYATRGEAKRVTISLVLPAHLVTYMRSIAKHTERSISLVAAEIIQEAINGDKYEPPTEAAS